jgi:hypothetical protein
MTTSLTRLLATFDFDTEWMEQPRPVQAQIGGVARAEFPSPLGYRRTLGNI